MIRQVFLDPASPACFASAENVLIEVRRVYPKTTLADVVDVLQRLPTYTLHKYRRVRFKRLRVVPTNFMSDVQADLADMQKIADANDNFRYIIVAVDVLSRRIFAAPTKSKGSSHMIAAFKRLFRQMPVLPRRIFTDKGLEFVAGDVKTFLQKQMLVEHLVAQSPDVKAAVAERFVRTLKSRLYKYFTANNTTRWIEVLPKICDAINRTKSRATGLRPNDVNFSNATELINRLYAPQLVQQTQSIRNNAMTDTKTPVVGTFREGDTVRIAKEKTIFEKSYLPNYTQKEFKIKTINSARRPVNYWLTNEDNQPIKGRFYGVELSRTKPNLSTEKRLIIEKVLKTRKRRGLVEYYVKWKGLAEQESSWITAADIL